MHEHAPRHVLPLALVLAAPAALAAVRAAPAWRSAPLGSGRARVVAGGTSAAADDAALQREYERYVAAVEAPLLNFDEEAAQRTQAVHLPALLSREDVAAVHRAGAAAALRRPDATIDRSAWGQPAGTWRVSFLNAGGAFEELLPELYGRVRDAMLAVDAAHWNATAGVEHVNYRVAEYHTMRSSIGGEPTRGGLHTQRHCDHGSLLTIDVLLTEIDEIEGGVLQTLEPDGTLAQHAWEVGDALVFLSHKYHCVSELTAGTRQVLVCELWQGTENQAPGRDEAERWQGVWKEEWRGAAGGAAAQAPSAAQADAMRAALAASARDVRAGGAPDEAAAWSAAFPDAVVTSSATPRAGEELEELEEGFEWGGTF